MSVYTTFSSSVNGNASQTDIKLGDRKWFKILKYTLYSMIFVVSLVGNFMVCYVVSRRLKLKTVTNYLIMNLALADLLYTLCIPLDIYASENTERNWPYGSFMCRVLWPAQTLAITVSGFTLTALSVTRYWCVVNPLKRQLSITQCVIVIMLLWGLATTTIIPYIIYLKYSGGKCKEEWPVFEHQQIYTASLFVIQYVIPLTIITTCYVRIGLELTKGLDTHNRMLAKARGEEAKRVIKMLVIVTLAFASLTLPSSIMWMWLDFGKADQKLASFWDIMDVLNILDFLNCATNPIIYSFCNESFSREFRRLTGCFRPPRSPDVTELARCTSFIATASTSNNNDHSKCNASNGDCTTLL